MWRKCDLHRHTSADTASSLADPAGFVAAAVAETLDVVAVTDHDRLNQVQAVLEAAAGKLVIVPGLEVTTTRGHVLALAPGSAVDSLHDLVARLGISPGTETDFEQLVDVVRHRDRQTGAPYRETVVLIAAY